MGTNHVGCGPGWLGMVGSNHGLSYDWVTVKTGPSATEEVGTVQNRSPIFTVPPFLSQRYPAHRDHPGWSPEEDSQQHPAHASSSEPARASRGLRCRPAPHLRTAGRESEGLSLSMGAGMAIPRAVTQRDSGHEISHATKPDSCSALTAPLPHLCRSHAGDLECGGRIGRRGSYSNMCRSWKVVWKDQTHLLPLLFQQLGSTS